MKNKHIEHQDPHRFPQLSEPIENFVIDLHEKQSKAMIMDVTKLMVYQKKKKKK